MYHDQTTLFINAFELHFMNIYSLLTHVLIKVISVIKCCSKGSMKSLGVYYWYAKNTTMQVYGAWTRLYYVLCSKTYTWTGVFPRGGNSVIILVCASILRIDIPYNEVDIWLDSGYLHQFYAAKVHPKVEINETQQRLQVCKTVKITVTSG